MIAYFDASALVKKYVNEAGSSKVVELLERATPVTCRLSEVEVTSALARRARQGHLTAMVREHLVRDLTEDMESLYVVEFVPEVVTTACQLLTRRNLGAADSIQLASAVVLQEKVGDNVLFVGFDERLQEAAHLEGLELVEEAPPG